MSIEDSRPHVTYTMLVDGLRNLGLADGDVVLVHSSLSRFGYVEGGADTVVDALLAAVGDEGTVAVPTSPVTWRGGSHFHYIKHNPILDLRSHPIETWRHYRGAAPATGGPALPLRLPYPPRHRRPPRLAARRCGNRRLSYRAGNPVAQKLRERRESVVDRHRTE